MISWMIILAIVFHNINAFPKHYCPIECICNGNTLNCSNLGLNKLPDGISTAITTFDFARNSFESVPSNIKLYKEVKRISFSRNKILFINEYDFSENVNLQTLDLSFNNIDSAENIHNSAFLYTQNLTKLTLANNNLGVLNTSFVSSSLQYLDLTNCSISSFNWNVFTGFPELSVLILTNNPITSIDFAINVPKLRTLNLSKCKLKRIHVDAIANLLQLKTLHLSHNELQEFNCRSRSLQELDLSNCGLSSLPNNGIKTLSSVNLSGNILRELPDDGFQPFQNLTDINLSKNKITKVGREAFRRLDYLTRIDLSFNPISKMDRFTFNTNFRLKYLYLSHTYLTEVPNFDIELLEMLDLSEGEINAFSKKALTKMPFLKRLNLSGNFITYIPDELESDSLETLDMTMCRVSSINQFSLKYLLNLKNLSLLGNRMTSYFNTSYLRNVENLYMSDNLWRCDCNSTAFWMFHDYMKDKALDYLLLKCSFPDNARGEHWEAFCGKYWYADDDNTRSFSIGISLAVALCVILCVGYFIKRTYKIKEAERRMAEEAEREEARRRLLLLRQRSRESVQEQNRNAPDPRDLQRPPSYNEAILLPRVDGSMGSLAGSQGSLHSTSGKKKRRRRARRKSRSKTESETDISNASQRERNRNHDNDSNSERQQSSTDEDCTRAPFKGYKESSI